MDRLRVSLIGCGRILPISFFLKMLNRTTILLPNHSPKELEERTHPDKATAEFHPSG